MLFDEFDWGFMILEALRVQASFFFGSLVLWGPAKLFQEVQLGT